MSSLIYEGVMDAFPRIKILICHGGGYLPFYAGRADITYIGPPHPASGRAGFPGARGIEESSLTAGRA